MLQYTRSFVPLRTLIKIIFEYSAPSMPRRRNKNKGNAPAGTAAPSKTASAVPAADRSNPVENLRHSVRSFLSSLRADCVETYSEHLETLQKSLEAHLRNHYTAIQSDATWNQILGWSPRHTTASAKASVCMHMPVSGMSVELPSSYNLPPAAYFCRLGAHNIVAQTWQDLGIVPKSGWVRVGPSATRAREPPPSPPAISPSTPPLQQPAVHIRAPTADPWAPTADPWADGIPSFAPSFTRAGHGYLRRGGLTRDLEALGRLRASTDYSPISPPGTVLDDASPENVRARVLASYFNRQNPLSPIHDSPLMPGMNANISSRPHNSSIAPPSSTRSSSHPQSRFTISNDNDDNDQDDADSDVHTGRFQDSFPRDRSHISPTWSAPPPFGDRYEFPALPARAVGQPVQPTQPGRNILPPRRPLAMTMPLRVQSNSVEGTIPRKLAEEASVLLELYSQSTYEDAESELQNCETIKTVLDNVNKIWDSVSRAGKGKQAIVAIDSESSKCECLTNGRSRATEPESDPALSPYSGCIICYTVVADAVLMPCHHLVLCVVSSCH